MFENLNQPYPFNNNFKHNLRTITFVCMGFMLIVLYFQPFGINFLATPKDGYFVLIIGLVSAAILFINTLILPGFFPRLFESARWTVRKEIIWNIGIFALLIVGFTLSTMLFRASSLASTTVLRSVALAVLPLILYNLVNYNHSLKTKVVQVFESGKHWIAEERKTYHTTPKENITLVSENGKEIFENELKNIVLIQSASNYIEIFYIKNSTVSKIMLRQTLNNVEQTLSSYSNIFKCHRCCLVNLDLVSRLWGSSPNYTLELPGLDFQVPVARQNVAKIRKLMASKSLDN